MPDSVPGVCYRSQPNGWVDRRVFGEWLSEPRAIFALFTGKKVLRVENCSGHIFTNETSRLFARINTSRRKLPANATNLVQPADTFVIAKIKDAWRRVWDRFEMEMIEKGEWMPGLEGSSGKLRNPGKSFFSNWLLTL